MHTIQLVVTGDLEKLALHDALRRHFPTQRNGRPVSWLTPRKTQGATTKHLSAPTTVYGPMRQLAIAAITELEVGRNGTPADLVVVVDDGEIGNLGDGHNIAAHFRLAMTEVIHMRASDPAANAALRRRVRERVSFHLFMPMVEAHFFLGRAALAECGVAPSVTPLLASSDAEQFESNDPLWLPICLQENARRAGVAPWWRHERHPKHYLQHLLDRSEAGIYEETSAAAQTALTGTEWGRYGDANGQFVRSLFEDIALWFDVPNPMGGGLCAPSTWPGVGTHASTLLLRNL